MPMKRDYSSANQPVRAEPITFNLFGTMTSGSREFVVAEIESEDGEKRTICFSLREAADIYESLGVILREAQPPGAN